MKLAIELGAEWPLIEHGEIRTVSPVSAVTEFMLDGFIEGRARQGVTNADADVIGHQIAHHLEGKFNIFARFAGIAKLQEEGNFNAVSVKLAGGFVNLLDASTLLHGIENFLGAAFSANPDDFSTGTGKSWYGFASEQQINPIQALERNVQTALVEQVSKQLDPTILYAHDVVHEPDMVGVEVFFQPGHFGDDIFRATDVVLLTPDGLGTPVAVKGATAGRNHIHGVVTVALLPDGAIAVTIHQVPGGEWERVQIADDGTGRSFDNAIPVAVGKAENAVEIRFGNLIGWAAGQAAHEFSKSFFAFTEKDVIGSLSKIGLGMVSHIRAADDDCAALFFGRDNHLEGGLAHTEQAHLAEVVEVVLKDDSEARLMVPKGRIPFMRAVTEHGIEEGHIKTTTPKHGSRIERTEGWIRLHSLPEFRIETQIVRLAEENSRHESIPLLFPVGFQHLRIEDVDRLSGGKGIDLIEGC